MLRLMTGMRAGVPSLFPVWGKIGAVLCSHVALDYINPGRDQVYIRHKEKTFTYPFCCKKRFRGNGSH